MSESVSNPPASRKLQWLISVCVGLGLFVGALDTTVNVALPTIAREFGIDVGAIQWIIIAFVTTSTGLSVSMGSAGDRFGLWRLFGLGLLVQALSMVLIGFAPNFETLIAFRVLQGIGAAAIMSVGPALIGLSFTRGERGRALGVATAAQAIGGVLAGFGGGMLVDIFGWSAIFFGRLPFIALALLLMASLLRDRSFNQSRESKSVLFRRSFDLWGATAMFIAVACLLIGLNLARSIGLNSLVVGSLLLGAIVSTVVFIRIERSVEWPVLDLTLFRIRGFTSVLLTFALSWLGAFTIWFIFPFYIADVLERGASSLGFLLGTLGLCTAIFASVGGWMADRVRPDWLVTVAAVVVSVALLWVSKLGADASIIDVLIPLALAGSGQGALQAAGRTRVFNSVPQSQFGAASGALNLGRSMGIVMSVAVFSSLFLAREDTYSIQLISAGMNMANAEVPAFVEAFQYTFKLASLVALLGGVTSLFAWESRNDH